MRYVYRVSMRLVKRSSKNKSETPTNEPYFMLIKFDYFSCEHIVVRCRYWYHYVCLSLCSTEANLCS